MKDRIYLDYAATTPVDELVMKAMKPYFSERFGNAGSLHSYGQEAIGALDKARETVAKSIGAKYEEIIFTSSATEANNLALEGLLSNVESLKKPRIIVSAIEHESILETAKDLERQGVEVVYIPVNKDGFVDLDKFEQAINENTVLVSVMYANNEIGTIQPIREIATIIRKFKERVVRDQSLATNHYPLLHTDAVQAFNYLDCNVDELHVDMMTLSSHKIYGPKGAGCLYVRGLDSLATNHYPLNPILTGGGQEFGYRSSTENIPGIVGFAKAAGIAVEEREKDGKRIAALRDHLWKAIRKIYPKAQLNGSLKKRLPNNLNLYIPGLFAETLLIKLDLAGVAISTGSACAARSLDPSHVLLALGYDDVRAKNSLRITLGRMTTKAEIDKFIKLIKISK